MLPGAPARGQTATLPGAGTVPIYNGYASIHPQTLETA